MDIATSLAKGAQTGPEHSPNAVKKVQFSLMLTVMRKMFIYSTFTTGQSPGLD